MKNRMVIRGFEVKESDDEKRSFSGLAAAYSLDQGGDVILPGAFKRTLTDFKRAKGKKIIPLVDSHARGTIRAVIGKMTDGEEVGDGLLTNFEVIDGVDGDESYRRVKGGYVDGLSIGYEAIEVRMPTADEARSGVYRFLKEVRLLEVSLVAFPMNVDARVDLTTVKSLLGKGDDLTPAERAELLEIKDALCALLAKAAPGDPPPALPLSGLAPEDPARLAIEAKVRGLKLSSLGVH